MNRKPALGGFRRAVAWIASVSLGMALTSHAQAPDTRPRFEVATIKPSVGGGRSSRSIGRVGDLDATNLSLKTLITEAYGVTPFEVIGGPGWIGSETFDITAKTSADSPPRSTSNKVYDDNQLRLQTLLEDRFALKVHRETRELPVYGLVVAKGGLKVQPSACVKPDADPPPSSAASVPSPPAFCGTTKMRRDGQNSVITGTGITMADLIRILSRVIDRTVIDRSESTQPFNATLEWTPDPDASSPRASDGSASSAPGAETTGASIFTALEEQLGLKLESTKGPVEVLVIDHVDKPTPN